MLRVGGATGLPGHIPPESPPSRAAPRRPTGRGAAAGRCCGSPSAPPGRPAPGLVADKSQRHRPDTTLGANWTRPPAQWPRHGNRPAVLALNWVEGHRKRRYFSDGTAGGSIPTPSWRRSREGGRAACNHGDQAQGPTRLEAGGPGAPSTGCRDGRTPQSSWLSTDQSG